MNITVPSFDSCSVILRIFEKAANDYNVIGHGGFQQAFKLDTNLCFRCRSTLQEPGFLVIRLRLRVFISIKVPLPRHITI